MQINKSNKLSTQLIMQKQNKTKDKTRKYSCASNTIHMNGAYTYKLS